MFEKKTEQPNNINPIPQTETVEETPKKKWFNFGFKKKVDGVELDQPTANPQNLADPVEPIPKQKKQKVKPIKTIEKNVAPSKTYLSIRFTPTKIFFCDYEFNAKQGTFVLHKTFNVKYEFNFASLNTNECANVIKQTLTEHDVNTKLVNVIISTHDMEIKDFISIKQKSYKDDLKVLEALNKKTIITGDSPDVALAYFITEEISDTPTTVMDENQIEEEQPKKQSLTLGKKPSNIHTITYITPVDILKSINEIISKTDRELNSVQCASTNIYNYYDSSVRQGKENCIVVHISDEFTTLNIIHNGVLMSQKVDNFGYSNIMSNLAIYVNSLKYTSSDESTDIVDIITKINLYTITEEVLKSLPSLDDAVIEQIIEAKNVLIEMTLDFIDRLKINIQNEKRTHNIDIDKIYIFNDILAYPDLTETIKLSTGKEVIDIVNYVKQDISINKFSSQVPIETYDYLLSMLCGDFNIVNLDNTITENRNAKTLHTRLFIGILGFATITTLSIVGFYTMNYVKETQRNAELNRKIEEGHEAQELYNQYMSIKHADDVITTFSDNTTTDLSNIEQQFTDIASIVPYKKVIIESITATNGEGTTPGSLNITIFANDKDSIAKFIIELEKLEYFDKIVNTSFTDNLGEDGEHFADGREIQAVITCYYPPHEEELPPEPEPTEGSEDAEEDVSEEDIMNM